MVMSPPRLWPLTDCNTNYRPVLLPERASQDEEQSNCPAKEKRKEKKERKTNLVMGPKGVPDTNQLGCTRQISLNTHDPYTSQCAGWVNRLDP
jgi:hypothetical protein